MPYQVAYSSQATVPMSEADLEQLLVHARSRNEARDVTGVLIYVDDVFLQILEGDKAVVQGLVQRIAGDPRHNGLKVFSEQEIDRRAFHGWRMAHLNATPQELSHWAGLSGTATLDEILRDIDRHPERVSRVTRGILQTLTG